MGLPKWVHQYITQDELADIESAIQDVEAKTSAEFVPMVVRSSSTVGHVPVILLLLLSMVVVYGAVGFQDLDLFDGLELLVLTGALLLVFGLTRLLAPLPAIERLLTARGDQSVQVEQRALIEFYQQRVNQTADKTGVLLFVSLMERQAVVLADEAIAAKYPAETWDHVIDQLITGVKNRGLAKGFAQGIKDCGEVLAQSFPVQPDDKNELGNTLIVKE